MYKIIVASYDCPDLIVPCLTSIGRQKDVPFEICVVDDGTPELTQTERIVEWCENFDGRVEFIRHDTNMGALYSQVEAIRKLGVNDDDVIVWVDGDDRLAHDNALNAVARHYERGSLLTYGNYLPDPPSDTCPRPGRYPRPCELNNDYRNAFKWGIHFNHLRTVSGSLFNKLIDSDFKDENGNWFRAAGDTAVMIPCLEMAGGRYSFISEVLYTYTSDNPISDWRTKAAEIDRIHNYIFTVLPRKDPV